MAARGLRITYKISVTVFKCLRDLAPSYLVELINIHERDSRLRQVDTLQLRQPVAKKSVRQEAFSVTGPRVWNALPTELRHTLSLASFKRQIRTFLHYKTLLYIIFITQIHYFNIHIFHSKTLIFFFFFHVSNDF